MGKMVIEIPKKSPIKCHTTLPASHYTCTIKTQASFSELRLLLFQMALRSLLFLSFFLFFVILQVSSDSETQGQSTNQLVKGTNRRLLPFMDCGGLCNERCSLHSRPNVCKRACRTCCYRCQCVPPGTAGKRELCGKCYTDMKTHGNKTKCP
ncbi:snakin-2-like [Mercurialis annua]|uniref:snakin-2-like n=1 Tax=Mercurialis annua TaxID=3986 RepID=UPI00215F9E46|nr:snakin-2-like [Mercurialis annua]